MTKLYGIIGWPVTHSLSPLFQNDYIKDAGINAAYLPFAVEPEQLVVALNGLQALGVEGFNVTVPHKEQVLHMVDADADARHIGAVNTLRRSDAGGWQATNTDWRGFRAVVEGLELDLKGKDVLLFGAGGTARAVLHALDTLQVGRLFICNRNSQRLATLMEHATNTYPELTCLPLSWEAAAVADTSASSALLINTTTVGLKEGELFPFPLCGDGAAIDAVYRPDGDTAFCQTAREAGRKAVDGLPMLIAQGAVAFAWWHGCMLPDCRTTLSRVEAHLGRTAAHLPGWSLQ